MDPGTFPDDGRDPALQRFLPRRAPSRVLRLLGGFRLLVDAEPVQLTPAGQRLVALLALLGCTGRSRAAGTLWPDLTEDHAAGCLRTSIWRVNCEVASLIEGTRSTVDLAAELDIDVRHYRSAAAGSMRSTTPTPAEDVFEAAEYEGDLLPEWDDDWVLQDRERLRQLRLHLLEEQADRLAGTGRFGPALDAAFAALSADPRRESVHRRIIGIHLAEGNLSEARRAFDTCRQVLLDDVGVEPSEATTRMLASVPRARGAGSAGIRIARRGRISTVPAH